QNDLFVLVWSGRRRRPARRPYRRTSQSSRRMTRSPAISALGQKQTFAVHQPMSALPPKADICSAQAPVCFMPTADMTAGRAYEVRSAGCSALRFDLSSKGLRYYLPIPHHKCVGSEFIRIVRCIGRPENIAVIALNRSVLHSERGARLPPIVASGKGQNLGFSDGLSMSGCGTKGTLRS